jgi:hypothetical protein
LDQAIAGVAEPVNQQDMESVRAEVERIAGSRSLLGLPSSRAAAGSLSDVARVNRVQGLTLGFGGILSAGEGAVRFQPSIAYGTSDDRLLGSFAASWHSGATRLTLSAARTIDDLSDLPVIAPLVNSILAQEAGKDYGDYTLLHSAELEVHHRLGARQSFSGSLGVVESQSLSSRASPANGRFRGNPPLGGGSHRVARLGLQRGSGGIGVRHDLQGQLSVEAGEGSGDYLRVAAAARWLVKLQHGELLSRWYLGTGTSRLPPYRSFVLGGRGTLVGEPFRTYGGREMGLAHVEWRFDVPIPSISLGSFASTGRHLTLAPFVAAGYAGRPLPSLPWTGTEGVRPVAGIAVEWLMRLIRVEAGVGLRDGHVGVTVDINRDWWGLL